MKNTSGSAKRQGAEPRRAFQAAYQVTFVPNSIILHFLTEIFIKILAQQLRKRILWIERMASARMLF
jgi:hypothetical protein